MNVSWCHSLQGAISSESKWRASIIFPSSLATLINDHIILSLKVMPNNLKYTIGNFPNSKHELSSSVDIVQLFNPSLSLLDLIIKDISSSNKYPQGAIFLFEGYNSFDDRDRLINDIKTAALNSGTILTIKRGYDVKPSRTKYKTTTLTCVHNGKYKPSINKEKEFSDDMVQQKYTIIQPHHHSSSTKGSSRYANLKRAHTDSFNSETKFNRSSTKQCDCSFQISIMYDPNTSGWYLKSKQSKSLDNIFHFNHVYIHPDHLDTSQSTLTPKVKESINVLINSGTPIPNILHIIKVQHGINLSYQTVYNMKIKQIDHIISNIPTRDPSGSCVDKLLSLFENISNVSFVYVLHQYNSGFVTYRKQRNESKSINITSNSAVSSENFCGNSARNWRQQLKLSHTNDILVAFAWCHDNEIRNTEMYPEFLGADITFGVNRQKRELLLVVGIVVNNKVFTAFRCFIPSKQEHPYTWIFNEAIPHLLTNDVLKYNQCISTDNELNLNTAVESSVVSNKQSFNNTRLRLDCFIFLKRYG